MRLTPLFIVAVFFGPCAAYAQTLNCPENRTIVELSGVGDSTEIARQRACFVRSVATANTIVRLGPHAVFDFSNDHRSSSFPIVLGSCVAIVGVDSLSGSVPCPDTLPDGGQVPTQPTALTAADGTARIAESSVDLDPNIGPIAVGPHQPGAGRTSRSLGPLLKFGNHSDLSDTTAFLQAGCAADHSSEGSSFSGFRIYGPSFGEQPNSNQVGIRIDNCLDVDVGNMEIAGWGGASVEVRHPDLPSPLAGPAGGTTYPVNWPVTISVVIHDSYLHHNQHASSGFTGGHSSGYGVEVTAKGLARIENNLFDFNKHSVTAGSDALGIVATNNLILKGGGVKNTFIENSYIHVFDEHGDDAGNDFNGGSAAQFSFLANSFQYKNSDDIGIRGAVRGPSLIEGNIFARSSETAALDFVDNNTTNIVIDGNLFNVDSYGQYDVCDMDGDGVDDLVLITGTTWWSSSGAQFPWTFLRADTHPEDQVRFGYFDNDSHCDVLVEHPTTKGLWFISSGGTSDWTPLAQDAKGQALNFIHPLSEVQFGRFDPRIRDHRPGVTRKTTHAFWRSPDGNWYVTPLDRVAWTQIGSSGFEFRDLLFGDFDGDGVTDVLAVEQGRWAFSSAGRSQWQRLNNTLNDPVQNLRVVNLDADDNIDDILKLVRTDTPLSGTLIRTKLTWWRSKNGVEPWKVWSERTFDCNPRAADVALACGSSYLGRFGAIPGDHQAAVTSNRQGAGTLTIDPWRRGYFYNPAEKLAGRPVTWTSDAANQFKY
jgi:hypothetical protein